MTRLAPHHYSNWCYWYIVLKARQNKTDNATHQQRQLLMTTRRMLLSQTVHNRLHTGSIYAHRLMVCYPLNSIHRDSRKPKLGTTWLKPSAVLQTNPDSVWNVIPDVIWYRGKGALEKPIFTFYFCENWVKVGCVYVFFNIQIFQYTNAQFQRLYIRLWNVLWHFTCFEHKTYTDLYQWNFNM